MSEILKKVKDGYQLNLKISPNASKNEIIFVEDGVKVKITAQPIDGKANKALIEYFSKFFKIPKTSISIIRGETSKEKTLYIETSEEKLQNLKDFFKYSN